MITIREFTDEAHIDEICTYLTEHSVEPFTTAQSSLGKSENEPPVLRLQVPKHQEEKARACLRKWEETHASRFSD